MKRAMILIIVLTAVCITASVLMDLYQVRIAEKYLGELPALRKAIQAGDRVDALARESLMYARWEHDAARLNAFISHHHTRSVSTALLQLSTAIEMDWPEEALKSIDLLLDALENIQCGDFCTWGNFL